MEIFLNLIKQNPIQFVAGILILFFLGKEKIWHALYIWVLAFAIYITLEVVGITEFIAGVVVGITANEAFSFFRKKLNSEE